MMEMAEKNERGRERESLMGFLIFQGSVTNLF
jgi:hypothetical protein